MNQDKLIIIRKQKRIEELERILEQAKIEGLLRDPNFMYELIQRESQGVKDNAKIEELKAELTYWKETAEYYKNKLNKTVDK